MTNNNCIDMDNMSDKNQMGFIHSVETMGAVDGPGLRVVIFFQGCPLRCSYCHNPDTWDISKGRVVSVDEVVKKVEKYKTYFGENGGVTFSGGEPLMQPKFLLKLINRFKELGIHTVIDTSGAICTDDTKAALKAADLVILDIKHTEKRAYEELTLGKFENQIDVLRFLKRIKKDYWIRQVEIEGLTDGVLQKEKLETLTKSKCRKKLEILPYHDMGKKKVIV